MIITCLSHACIWSCDLVPHPLLQLMVTGMNIHVIYKNCQLRLLDVITEVDGKAASEQQFEKIRVDKKYTAKLTVFRSPLHTLSCADIGRWCVVILIIHCTPNDHSQPHVHVVIATCSGEGLEWGEKEDTKVLYPPHGHSAPSLTEEGRRPGCHPWC